MDRADPTLNGTIAFSAEGRPMTVTRRDVLVAVGAVASALAASRSTFARSTTQATMGGMLCHDRLNLKT